MKNKIGVITFHESINYGAYLQAYALTNAVEKEVNIRTELVNYTPFYKKLFYYVKALSKLPKGEFIKHMKQIAVFSKAQKQLKLSKKITTSNYGKQCDFLNKNYKAIIVGSDEVLTAGKSRMMPFPNIYWPNEKVTIPKFTYAGSANRANYTKLPIEDQTITKKIFENYRYIGVRDYYSQGQVLSLNKDLKTNINCDPTFLMDFNLEFTSHRDSLAKKFKKLTDKPIIAIMTKNNNIGLEIKKKFGKEYFLLAVYYPNDGADYFIADMSPQEWAVGFSLYAGCVTQLFHGTVFCLKNNLPFVSFDNNSDYDGRASKISDILSRSDLLENYFNLRQNHVKIDNMILQLEKNLEKPQKEKMIAAVENQKRLFYPFIDELKKVLNDIR
ncbi:polysaccharide pyruvyl transferase family protein [Planobacterium oryzisoli]|uniref:Polysaccharide pyruvyl transferase family protein n=1 Tax=Planobacterium oryzisoli TaxID=2771435 RepID=A0A931E7D8_9FLAO|nr:polysaccharide pyruvyl transferase family protein [Planobacterium oryzisoli]MBF5027126.1 polysaccharide pyruvyl transferase family protein [Planobacterium oryzisoli]